MRLNIWLFTALLPLFLIGCTGGSYVIHIGSVESSTNSISGNYTSFSGYYFKEEKFSEGDTIHFNFSKFTDKGTLSAKLLDPSGRVIEKIYDDQDIKITKTSKYKVQVNGKNHKGSFILSWKKTSKED